MFALFARSASTICSFIHNMAYMRSAGVWHITHYPHTFGNRTREQVLGERFLLLCIARWFVSQSHAHCECTGIGLLIHVYFSFHHIFFPFRFCVRPFSPSHFHYIYSMEYLLLLCGLLHPTRNIVLFDAASSVHGTSQPHSTKQIASNRIEFVGGHRF